MLGLGLGGDAVGWLGDGSGWRDREGAGSAAGQSRSNSEKKLGAELGTCDKSAREHVCLPGKLIQGAMCRPRTRMTISLKA